MKRKTKIKHGEGLPIYKELHELENKIWRLKNDYCFEHCQCYKCKINRNFNKEDLKQKKKVKTLSII